MASEEPAGPKLPPGGAGCPAEGPRSPGNCLLARWAAPELRRKLKEDYSARKPFKHISLRPFLGSDALRALRASLQGVELNDKVTDVFTFGQSDDLRHVAATSGGVPAKRRRTESTATDTPPSDLTEFVSMFSSKEFRQLCSDITGCGPLTKKLDLSSHMYRHGGHMMLHDDAIGDRKISFIYYLTDPDEEWTVAEGGALELYAQDPEVALGIPRTHPEMEILPTSDTLVFFVVEAGVSFHAVREVVGPRGRWSVQGWLHAKEPAGVPELSTQARQLNPHLPVPIFGKVSPTAPPKAIIDTELGCFEPEDVNLLSSLIAPIYLETGGLKMLSDRFVDASQVVLSEFLRADVASEIAAAVRAVDAADRQLRASSLGMLPYSAGGVDGWQLVGPPHLQRYLRFDSAASAGAEATPHGRLGTLMRRLAELFDSPAFRLWLEAVTLLRFGPVETEVRRFRPGMDYTCAATSILPPSGYASLDITLSFVAETQRDKEDSMAAASRCAELWSSEEFGGYISYMPTEQEDGVENRETYRGTVDPTTPVLNFPAAQNTLVILVRDGETHRFAKFLGCDAPSSRLDITAVCPVNTASDPDTDVEADTRCEGEGAESE